MGNCNTAEDIRKVSFDEVKEGLGSNAIYLIDVRTSKERVTPGRIPGSLHVPLGEIVHAFSESSAEEFEARYDFKRPHKNDRGGKVLVLTCQSGMRASQAAGKLANLGFEDLALYSGSFNDWKAKGGQIINGAMDQERVVDFSTVQTGLNNEELLVIDVRNGRERRDPGYIPGTQNVPLDQIWEAFDEGRCSSADFEAKYGFSRPSKSSLFVTHCLRGKRALDASDKLALLGYQNVRVYKGSFIDWRENGGEVAIENDNEDN